MWKANPRGKREKAHTQSTRDDNDTLQVTCPTFPEVTTFGADEGEAVAMRFPRSRKPLRRASATAIRCLGRSHGLRRRGVENYG